MIICNASDSQSRCARGCQKNARNRRNVERSSVYTLAQGPITVDFNDDYEEKDDPAPQTLDTEGSKFKGPSLVMALLQKH